MAGRERIERAGRPHVPAESRATCVPFRFDSGGAASAGPGCRRRSMIQGVVRGLATGAEHLAEASGGCRTINLDGSVALNMAAL